LNIEKDFEIKMEQIVTDLISRKDAKKPIVWSVIFLWFLTSFSMTFLFLCFLHSSSRKKNKLHFYHEFLILVCSIFTRSKIVFFIKKKILQFIAISQFTTLAHRSGIREQFYA
jgi:hypothetical protein